MNAWARDFTYGLRQAAQAIRVWCWIAGRRTRITSVAITDKTSTVDTASAIVTPILNNQLNVQDYRESNPIESDSGSSSPAISARDGVATLSGVLVSIQRHAQQTPSGRESTLVTTSLHLCGFIVFMHHACLTLAVLLLVILSACVAGYAAIKFFDNGVYSTYTFQYSYLISAGFMTGESAAVLVLMLWAFLVAVVMIGLGGMSRFSAYLVRQDNARAAKTDKGVDVEVAAEVQEGTNRRRCYSVSRAFIEGFGGLVIILTILLANVGYLYVALSSQYSPVFQTLAQVALAAFKFVITAIVVRTFVLNPSIFPFCSSNALF